MPLEAKITIASVIAIRSKRNDVKMFRLHLSFKFIRPDAHAVLRL